MTAARGRRGLEVLEQCAGSPVELSRGAPISPPPTEATEPLAVLNTPPLTAELLPGCVTVPEREHFGVSFGKDSGTQDGAGDQ
jgi:hypothetical protein